MLAAITEAFLDLLHRLQGDASKTNPTGFITLLAAVSILVYYGTKHLFDRSTSQPCLASRVQSLETQESCSNSEVSARSAARQPGTWTPHAFTRPKPAPYPYWSLTTTAPLTYRPFRHGPHHITMGLRTMRWDEWIELDNEYLKFHALKAQRIATRGAKCCRTEPEPRVVDGAVELLEELASYLPARYPTLFRKTKFGIDNLATGECFDIRKEHLTVNNTAEDPMQLSARLVQDDLAIMFERKDGQYSLSPAQSCSRVSGALRINSVCLFLRSTRQATFQAMHTNLEKGMMNFFRRVQPDKAVVRNNYFIQVDDGLAWSESIGSEDGVEGSFGWDTAAKNRIVEHHWFRSERQSLRRLPRSGGVVFTIRTYFHPVVEIAKEPYVPGRLASAVRSWGDDVAKYKGRERYGDVLLEYLDAKHQEQTRNGLDLEKEESARAYPW